MSRPRRVQPYQNTRHGRRAKIDHGSRQIDRQPPDHTAIPAHGSKGQAIWVRVAYGRRGEERGKRERAYQHVGSSEKRQERSGGSIDSESNR